MLVNSRLGFTQPLDGGAVPLVQYTKDVKQLNVVSDVGPAFGCASKCRVWRAAKPYGMLSLGATS